MKNVKKNALLTATLMILSIMGLKAQQPDFSGTWVRNDKACQLDTSNTTHIALSINSIPVKIVIKYAGNTFTITRISVHGNGDSVSYAENLKPGGTKSKTVIKPNFNKNAALQWSADHHLLLINSDYTDDHGNPVQKATETWSFLSDGMQLQIKTVLTFDGQEHILIEVFDKE